MSLGKALRSIVVSVLLFSGIPWLTWGIYRYFWNARAYDAKYNIVALVQTGPEKEPLKTAFLAELLNLSIDQPTNLYKLDLSEGRSKLLAFPLIQEATLKRIPPGTLYVDYTVRKPIAFLGNATNASLDAEWRLLPFKPFFSPKKLPEIWVEAREQLSLEKLSLEKLSWGDRLTSPSAKLAHDVLKELEQFKELILLRIDTSRAYAASLGEKQLIIILEEQKEKGEGLPTRAQHTVILNPDTYQEGLKRYSLLRQINHEALQEGIATIDLRLPELGFFKGGAQ